MKPQFIQEVRAFNRFYTRVIGLLDKHILNSAYSLPEVRILFELNTHIGLTASEIIELIDIDKGYLSRILKKFEKDKLVIKVKVETDKRAYILQLTSKGKLEFDKLNRASDKQVEQIFQQLNEKECNELLLKMKEIQALINKTC